MTANPIASLTRYLTGWAKSANGSRRFLEAVGVETAQDITAEVVERSTQVARVSHSAEIHDLEALKAFDAAQHPDSEGGEMITPNEAKRIRGYVAKSAELDHSACELSTV